jgi:hypothetical protein
VAQVDEHLLCKHEAQSSNSSPTKKKKKKKKKKKNFEGIDHLSSSFQE